MKSAKQVLAQRDAIYARVRKLELQFEFLRKSPDSKIDEMLWMDEEISIGKARLATLDWVLNRVEAS